MKVLSSKVHGVLDYLVGIFLIFSPWILGFADEGGAAAWVPVLVGATAVVYSIFTNYELGLIRTLSMRTHLILDFASGALLAVSPWLFGFADVAYLPHLILGILEMGAALMTKPVAFTDAEQEVHTHRTHAID